MFKKFSMILILPVLLLPSLLFSESLKIKGLTNYWDGNLAIIGLIKNEKTTAVSYVQVGLICRGSTDQLVYTDTTYALCPIPPNDEIPFRFLISEADTEDIKTYSVSIDDYSIGGSGTFNFEIGQLSITEKNDLFHKYSGIIKNPNSRLYKYVNICFLGFDENGELEYYDNTYPKKSNIPAGGESFFEILIPPKISDKIDKYRCFAYAD